MRRIHSFRQYMLFLIFMGTSILSISAATQVQQPHSGDAAIIVNVTALDTGVTATFEVFSCTADGHPSAPSLSNKGVNASTTTTGQLPLVLNKPLSSGDSVCIVETDSGVGAPVINNLSMMVAATKIPAVAAPGVNKPLIAPVYTGALMVAQVTPVPPPAGDTATIEIFTSCPAPEGASGLQTGTNSVNAANPTIPIPLYLPSSPQKNSSLCAVEKYHGPVAKSDDISTSINVEDPPVLPSPQAKSEPSAKTGLQLVRLSGGIDVSAAASVDPAAKFLVDGALEVPLIPKDYKLDSHWWGGGYIRLASIAQPGAVSGISNVATYVKPLVDSSPAQLVQSAEGTVGLEFHFTRSSLKDSKDPHQPTLFSAVANAGIITPLSQSQSNPTIYIVSQQLYNFYTQANADQVATSAIKAACGSSFDSNNPCYIAYLPQDRTRFYRNYAAGVIYKKYYYNAQDDSFGFPGIAILTVGQNEYITRGQLRGFVLHAGANWPLSGSFPTVNAKWAGAVYVYGAIDMNLSGKNQNSQEYLLQTAGSSVTLSSSRLASFSVPQQDRDRYRFGIGVDLLKLFQ